jgi:hypothetical protein
VGSRALDRRRTRSRDGRPLSRLTYVKRGFCICRVVRDPQLGIESTMVAVASRKRRLESLRSFVVNNDGILIRNHMMI